MVREEEVGGAETHEMDPLGPRISSAASSLPSVHAAQNINEAQSIIEGVTSIWPCCLIRRQLFCSFIGSSGSDVRASVPDPEKNIDQSRNSDGVSGTTRDRPTQAEEVQTRACFPSIVEMSKT